tara:strand:- start:1131 stop:1997 length:867 start_codon:yes stop_codon:yes gene_type:complete
MRQLSFDDRLRSNTQQLRTKRRNLVWPAIRKRLKTHRRFICFFLSFASIALAAGIWLSQPGTISKVNNEFNSNVKTLSINFGLKVNNVYSEGRSKTSISDLLEAIGIQRGDPILNFDAESAKDRVESLGWVKSAQITRKLPDNIHIKIIERRPFALWQNEGKIVLIDREGSVINDALTDVYSHLPIIVGKNARETAPILFQTIAEEPYLYERVVAAVRIGNRRWDIIFEGGIRVYLPEINMSKAWSRLASANLENNFFDSDVKVIDLRFPDRMILRINTNKIDNEKTT